MMMSLRNAKPARNRSFVMRRQALVAALGSLFVHGVVLILLSARKVEPKSDILDKTTEFDLVHLLEDAKALEDVGQEPAEGSFESTAEVEQDETPQQVEPVASRRRKKTPRKKGAKRVVVEVSDESESQESSKGSSLLTMRGSKSPRARLPSGPLMHRKDALALSIERPVDLVPSSARGGDPSQGAHRRGRAERKIGDYSFYQDADGNLSYRDPQKDFIALITPNGDVEFETRAPASGGLCALGVCVQAGGLRKKGERKRKHLNRVRIRFAPVPLGVGIQFGSLRGVERKKLELMQATFQARFEMRIDAQHRLQKAALAGLDIELEEIITKKPASVARKIVLARALEIDVERLDETQRASSAHELLRRLVARKKVGAAAMCERILALIRRDISGSARNIFIQEDADRVERHCERLKR